MEVNGYIIPSELRDDGFILRLAWQEQRGGMLSTKQIRVLQDKLDFPLDWFGPDLTVVVPEEMQGHYEKLLDKMQRDRFIKVRTRNNCIRAIESIELGRPDIELIDKVVGTNEYWKNRARRRKW